MAASTLMIQAILMSSGAFVSSLIAIRSVMIPDSMTPESTSGKRKRLPRASESENQPKTTKESPKRANREFVF